MTSRNAARHWDIVVLHSRTEDMHEYHDITVKLLKEKATP